MAVIEMESPADEFEARTALLLTQKEAVWEPCFYGRCPHGAVVNLEECGQCRLKHARIAVEQEMEQEEPCLKN